MEIVESWFRGVPLLTVVGEVDHRVGEDLAASAKRALSPGGAHILLDLKLCAYLDSGGLGVILSLVQQVGPLGWVGVVHPSRMVLRLLGLAGLTGSDSLRVFSSLDEAVREIG